MKRMTGLSPEELPLGGMGLNPAQRPVGGTYEMGLFCATPPEQMRVSVTALSG
jgi:hypothetical protein